MLEGKTMNNNRASFVNHLSRANVSKTVKEAILSRYDMLVDHFGPEEGHNAAVAQYLPESVLQESHASALNIRLPQTQTGKEIESALEDANKKTVEIDGLKRTRAAIKRYRDNLAKVSGAQLVSAFTGGRAVNILSDEELAALDRHAYAKDNTFRMEYEAWSSFKQGRANLE